MEAFETFEHAGFTCELHQDEDPQSPADWDTLGTLYRFSMGANHGAPGEDAPWDVQEAANRDRPGLVVRYLRTRGEYAVLVRFQDYGSGGARIDALGEDEDARATGYISTTPARILELCGPPQIESDAVYCPRLWPEDGRSGKNWDGTAEEWIATQLRGELREWNAYFGNEVVGYVVRESVETLSGRNVGAVVESCWGFYPDDEGDGLEYVRQEARNAAEAARDDRAELARLAARGWAIAHGLGGGLATV